MPEMRLGKNHNLFRVYWKYDILLHSPGAYWPIIKTMIYLNPALQKTKKYFFNVKLVCWGNFTPDTAFTLKVNAFFSFFLPSGASNFTESASLSVT